MPYISVHYQPGISLTNALESNAKIEEKPIHDTLYSTGTGYGFAGRMVDRQYCLGTDAHYKA